MLEKQHTISLDRAFFDRPAVEVAPDLLGHLLVHETKHGVVSGIVVETEAYMQDDRAFHAWGVVDAPSGLVKPVGRAYDLFGPPAHAYIYLCYGMYWLLNVVTEREGVAGCVLIRAIQPWTGFDVMWQNRPNVSSEINLANGPGKLTIALGIDKTQHKSDLTRQPIYFSRGKVLDDVKVETTTRIGISRAIEKPWRYLIAGNVFVSPGIPSDIAAARRRAKHPHSQ